MALKFDPFANDRPASTPVISSAPRQYAKLRVFDDPPPLAGDASTGPADDSLARAAPLTEPVTRRQLEDNSETKEALAPIVSTPTRRQLGDNSETRPRGHAAAPPVTRRRLGDDSKTPQEKRAAGVPSTRKTGESDASGKQAEPAAVSAPTRRQLGDNSETKTKPSAVGVLVHRDIVESDSKTTRRQLGDSDLLSRRQLGDDSETTRRQSDTVEAPTRRQLEDDLKTTRRRLEDDSKTKDPIARRRLEDNSETTRRRSNEIEVVTRRRLEDDSETKDPITRRQLEDNSETTRRHEQADSETTRRSLEDKTSSTRRRLEDDSETPNVDDSKTKRAVDSKTKRDLPSSPMQLKLLRYLAKEQGDQGQTPTLSRAAIAEATGFEKKSIPQTIRRLLADGFVRQMSYSHSSSGGGGSYAVPRHILTRLASLPLDSETKTLFNSKTQLGDNSKTAPHVVSSSLNTTTTTTGSVMEEAQRFQQLVERLRLDEDLRLGANDLADAWRQTGLDIVLFSQSVEHVAFYARSEDGASIKFQKAWCMKQLKSGYYGEPVGFVSWEEQQQAAALEASRRKLERLQQLRKEKFDTDYQIWKMELSTDERQRIFHGSPLSPASPGAEALLREKFAVQTNQADILSAF